MINNSDIGGGNSIDCEEKQQIESISFSNDLSLRWRKFDGQVVFYVEQSATTHVMDESAASILLRIYEGPVGRGDLLDFLNNIGVVEQGDDAEKFLDTTISSFKKLGLVSFD